MFCQNCAEILTDEDTICPKCGFVAGTGTHYCPTCGEELLIGATVCEMCGTRIPPSAQSQENYRINIPYAGGPHHLIPDYFLNSVPFYDQL